MNLSPSQQHVLLDAARDAIRRTLRGDAPTDEQEARLEAQADPALLQPAGCFATLHRRTTHELRGCVGRLDASEPLLRCVRRSAINVLRDPRFTHDPVRLSELPQLEIDLSVLSPLRPAPGPLDFDLHDDGIYLKWLDRTGCFLPVVARETGWSKEQLLSRLCVEKMGLPLSAWKDPRAKLFTFTTQVLGPEPFEPDQARGEHAVGD